MLTDTERDLTETGRSSTGRVERNAEEQTVRRDQGNGSAKDVMSTPSSLGNPNL